MNLLKTILACVITNDNYTPENEKILPQGTHYISNSNYVIPIKEHFMFGRQGPSKQEKENGFETIAKVTEVYKEKHQRPNLRKLANHIFQILDKKVSRHAIFLAYTPGREYDVTIINPNAVSDVYVTKNYRRSWKKVERVTGMDTSLEDAIKIGTGLLPGDKFGLKTNKFGFIEFEYNIVEKNEENIISKQPKTILQDNGEIHSRLY